MTFLRSQGNDNRFSSRMECENQVTCTKCTIFIIKLAAFSALHQTARFVEGQNNQVYLLNTQAIVLQPFARTTTPVTRECVVLSVVMPKIKVT